MGAAAWTRDAVDITEAGADEWGKYLTVQKLSDEIGLAVATIMDTLARNPLDADPRSAIFRPAARIGQTALAAVPLWAPEQRDRYLKLAKARNATNTVERKRKSAGGAAGLPVHNVAEAAERGLASTEELAEITGVAENTLRRWARENRDFPPEVGIAERVPPHQMGPPRTLRKIQAVKDWIAAYGQDRGRPFDADTADEVARDAEPVPAA